jgi:hypothetical protein
MKTPVIPHGLLGDAGWRGALHILSCPLNLWNLVHTLSGNYLRVVLEAVAISARFERPATSTAPTATQDEPEGEKA